jgi:hypothetical protein
VRHVGWESLPGAAALVAAHREGWRLHLDALRRFVEV